MSERRGLLGEISWLQVVGSALAAVTAAWLASRLGVAGTMIGVALGSFVATVSSAIYARTLDKGKTLLVQTASGTVIQKTVQDGDIAEAFEQAAEVDDSPVERAEVVADDKPGLNWRRIIVVTAVVVALALATISTIELVTGKTLDGSRGTTIGDTFGGTRGDTADEPEDPEPTSTPTETEAPPTPTASAPAPTLTTPTATPTPAPTRTTPPPTTETPPEPEE